MNIHYNNKLFGLFLLAVLVLSGTSLQGQDSLKTYLATGSDLLAKGDYLGGLKSYQNALRLDTNNVVEIRNIGRSYLHLDNQKQAQVFLERAHKIDPTDAQVCNNLGVMFASIDHSEKHFGILNWQLLLIPLTRSISPIWGRSTHKLDGSAKLFRF